jgi:DNA-binding PadR family transcriptional regulator
MRHRSDSWPFCEFFGSGFDPRSWAFGFSGCGPSARPGDLGDIRYAILRLLKEKPRQGYEIIHDLEEKLAGWCAASPSTVYPTLQLLEDEGYVRVVDSGGKRAYHITAEGERFLNEHKNSMADMIDRLAEALRVFAEGPFSEFNVSLTHLAKVAWAESMRAGTHSEGARRIIEILRRAADEIENLSGKRAS